jgi:hypothetical protein
MTADGLKLLHVTQPVLEQVDANRVFGVSAALRQFLPLPHVVGVAEVEEELVWLVDARRLRSSSEGHGHRMPPAEPEGRDA